MPTARSPCEGPFLVVSRSCSYIEKMVATHVTEDFGQLVDLIASTEDIKSVLDGLAAFAAAAMTNTAGVPVS